MQQPFSSGRGQEEEAMTQIGKLTVAADGDRRIVVRRDFDAPRDEVFDAYTKPEQVQHWLGVFGGWEMSTCELEPRIGGTWRYVWTGPGGATMTYRATCTEFAAPERITTSAAFEPPWFEGEERGTVAFEELGSRRTRVTLWLRYATTKIRDEVLASPMAQGMALSYDGLEAYLAEPAERWMDAEAGVP
jgi:uncharacterized protein YndB with AHSA1/START domain